MEILWQLAVIHLLALASPGPDFFLVVRNSLAGGTRAGVMTSLGIAGGISVHLTLGLLGVTALLRAAPGLSRVLLVAGAAYLVYLGASSLLRPSTGITPKAEAESGEGRSLDALRQGFIVNLLNVKAGIYFLGVFATVLTPETAAWIKALASVEMIVLEIAWFSFIAWLVGKAPGISQGGRFWRLTERLLGAGLIVVAAFLVINGWNVS